uniref:Protein kinase domain-containing protein n=1 Tax=Setaria viridis TaxID=4556 RepID=A0A4U6W9S4_SETVI|nr:hypothetical protein SEVIR_1G119200v2 [Setaria viridis]
MVYRRYCPRALSRFLLLVPLLSLFHDESVAAVDASSSLQPDKAQEAIMMNLSNSCDWAGVSCSRSGSSSSLVVTNITLSNYGISNPSILASLCLLDTLLSLDLSRNNFTDLGDKFSTTSCHMKKGLLSLNLSSNQLSHRLSEFSGLPQLEVLDLSFNLFTDGNLSSDFGSFPKLRSLNLSSNKLNGDVSVSMASSLEELVLSGNQLSGTIPPDLSQNHLTANQNNFTGAVPSRIANHVRMLDLSYDKLSGKIPPNFLSHMGLQIVTCLKGLLIPSHLSRSLYRLRLGGNRLSGNIPRSICDGVGLAYLELDGNQLTGNIPAELSKYLQGPVPDAINSLDKLVVLKLQNNSLSGPIPNLSFLNELEILDISYNNLYGEVPSSLGSLQSLAQLVLSYNNLSGFVPHFRQNVEIDIGGNTDLENHAGNNNHTRTRRAYDIVVITFVATGALVGLCYLVVIATMVSFPKRIYRVESGRTPTGEGVSQIHNGCLVTMNCIRTSALMFVKEKEDDWRITAFQALNFEAADMRQGLTEDNLVGSGGSGHVYRVTYNNRHNGNTGFPQWKLDYGNTGVVAVKQIRSVGSLDEKREREFESEASILCNIRHNNRASHGDNAAVDTPTVRPPFPALSAQGSCRGDFTGAHGSSCALPLQESLARVAGTPNTSQCALRPWPPVGRTRLSFAPGM